MLTREEVATILARLDEVLRQVTALRDPIDRIDGRLVRIAAVLARLERASEAESDNRSEVERRIVDELRVQFLTDVRREERPH